MTDWLKRRRMRKLARHALMESRRARYMHEDIADSASLQAAEEAEQALRTAQKGGAPEEIEAAMDRVAEAIERIAPSKPNPRLREYVEIIVVAIAVAMAFRTYFIQPFKIPTGSMQPTLYGISVEPQAGRQWYDQFPINLLSLALFGERYQEIRAKSDGLVDMRYDESEEAIRVYIGGVPHEMPRRMSLYVQPGKTFVRSGQIIASGRTRMGDHIFVNKLRYNFMRPKRGDIFVFSTTGIKYERIRPNSFYIKRMAGMPGERLRLEPPYLVADGKRITEPYPFERLLKEKDKGYNGYQLPYFDRTLHVALGLPGEELHLSDTEYLPLGDNTLSSLDGRYFGAVQRTSIVGPAFMVYWPLGSRWGWVQ